MSTPHPARHPRHVIVGAGPVGTATALELARRGHEVVVASRRGTGPSAPGVSLATVDATDAAALTRLADGAAALYNCVNPPYHRWATEWPPIGRAFLQAAERTGAVLVMIDNLYAFGPDSTMPMREGDPMRATGAKGGARAALARELLDAHAAGRVRATLARASDFVGPEVRGSAMGERVLPRVLAGRKVSVLGGLDVPHHLSFMPDVARTLATLGTDERAWGRPWHVPNAPALTQREAIAAFARAAGTDVKVASVPWAMVSALGLVVPFMRELAETRYQFDRPWVVDSSVTEQTLGLSATPFDQVAAETVAWWRAQGGAG
jgi:nucleoside-diphosphate-sugar epimerase